MKIQFFTGGEFVRQFKRLSKKYKSLTSDIIALHRELQDQPEQGVDLGGGVRKIRISITSKGQGKSGGARVLTLNVLIKQEPEDELDITFLAIYDKSEIDNVSDAYIRDLVKQVGSNN